MSRLALTESEISARLPVWCALSDLFLDTEPQDYTYDHIARVIRESGFGAGKAEDIFRSEVAPTFAANLLSPASAWQGWDQDFVRAAVLDRATSPASKAAILPIWRQVSGRAMGGGSPALVTER